MSDQISHWLAAILTRSERGASEVRTRSEIKFWETDLLSLLTNSLVATRFRILFRTVNSRAFSGGAEELQARARRQKRRQRASKGDRGETGCTAQQDGRESPTQWRTRANAYISNTYIVGKATEICQVNIVDASHEPGVPMQIAKQMHQ